MDKSNKFQINELWRIQTNNEFWDRDGKIYGDDYLVWADDSVGERVLIAYDIKTQEKKWQYNFTQHYGWGQEMFIQDRFLYCDKLDLGFTIFDLYNKVAIGSVRHDATPNFTSFSKGYMHDGKLYKSNYAPYQGLCVAFNYDMADLSKKIAFQWLQNPDLKVNFTSPVVVYNQNQQKENLIMLLNLKNQNSSIDTVDLALIINVNEGYSINWIDTLDSSHNFNFNEYPPTILGNDALFVLGGKVYSYDYVSGTRNWATQADGSYFSKIIIIDDELYVIANSSRLLKLNPDTGEIIWTSYILGFPFNRGNFELYRDKMVFSYGGFGPIMVLNNLTGRIESINNPITNNLGHPKLYKKEGIFITHSNKEIIAFEFRE